MKRCVQCIRLKGFPPRVGPGTARSEKKYSGGWEGRGWVCGLGK